MLCLFFFILSYAILAQENTYFSALIGDEIDPNTKSKKLDSLVSVFKEKKPDSLAFIYNNYAYYLFNRDSLAQAVEYNELSLELAQKHFPKDTTFLRLCNYEMGFYYRKNQKYPESILPYLRTIAYGSASDAAILSYFDLGLVYTQLGDYHKAVKNYETAVQQLWTLDYNKTILLKALINLSYLNFQIKSFESLENGKSWGEKADSLSKKLDSPLKTRFNIAYNLGSLHSEKQNLNADKARIYYGEALSLATKMGDQEQSSIVYYGLGDLYNILDVDKSIEYYGKALKDLDSSRFVFKADIYNGIGHTYRIAGDFDKSLENRHAALSILTGNDFRSPRSITQDILTKNETSDALFHILPQLAETYLSYYDEHSKNNQDLDKSIAYFKMADLLLDEIRKGSTTFKSRLFWRTVSTNLYSKAIEACFLKKDMAQLFYYIEKNKALLLLEDLYIAKQNRPPKVSNPDNTSFVLKPSISDLKEIQSTLKKDEGVMLYHLSKNLDYELEDNNKAYGLYITQNSTLSFKIDNRDSLQNDVNRLLTLLSLPFKTKNDLTIYQILAFSVYKRLFPTEKIRASITDQKLTIIPDGKLALLPFEALLTSDLSNSYFIEKSIINYAHSNSFLKEISTEKITGDALGIAPIQFNSLGLLPLSGSKVEINALLEHYRGVPLLQNAASKENFSESNKNKSIIHLATHADAEPGGTPWIAFYDEKMELDELYEQKIRADLVILSACKTGIGENADGEGIMNLARGFFYTGSKSVISSSWSIGDDASSKILSDFYKNLSQGHRKGTALRAAKLAYLTNHKGTDTSPYYWAPLVLWGVDDTLPSPKSPLWPYFLLLAFPVIFFLFKRYKKQN